MFFSRDEVINQDVSARHGIGRVGVVDPGVSAHVGQPEVEYATPLEDDEDRLDAYYDDEPLRYRTVANILEEQSPPD